MDRKLLGELASGSEDAALVTIVRVKGSAPRHEGTAMLVYTSGACSGTVGGGRGEAAAIAAARRALDTGISSMIEVEMLGDDPSAESLICGGVNTMLVEPRPDRNLYAAAHARVAAGGRILVERDLSGVGRVARVPTRIIGESDAGPDDGAVLAAGETRYDEASGRFLVAVMPEERMVILGGGHVGRALARAAAPLGFTITVVDDRPDFAAGHRYPEGVRAVCAGYVQAIGDLRFDSATYAIIVTRGHLFDLDCARAVLQGPFRYAGLIGSSRKVALIRQKLAEEGVAASALEAFRAPIGLDIGAETPEEIAVSILAQVIMHRRSPSPEKSAAFMA